MSRHTLNHFQGKPTEKKINLAFSSGSEPKSLDIIITFDGNGVTKTPSFRVTKGNDGVKGVRYFYFEKFNFAVDKYNQI